MDTETLKAVLAATWVVFGVAQAALALASGLPALAALGVAFAVLGGAYYWTEVHRESGD